MPLPDNGLWTVRLAVTRRFEMETGCGRNRFAPGDRHAAAASRDSEPSLACQGTELLEVLTAARSSREEDGVLADPTDWVSIRMGGSLQSMVYVGSVKNVMNEDFGEVGALPRLAARGQTRKKWTRDGFLAVLALRPPKRSARVRLA